MIDINLVRDNPKLVAEKSAQKGVKVDVKKLLEVDRARRELAAKIENLRAKRNEHTQKLAGRKPDAKEIEAGRKIREELNDLESPKSEFAKADRQLAEILKTIPNLPTDDVPVGASEKENKVVKTVSDKPKFDFEPKNHAELAEAKGWIDKERAAKVAGARFAYLKGDLVRLEFALWQFAFDQLGDQKVIDKIIKDNKLKVSNKVFVPVLPPAIAKTEVYESTGRLDKTEMTYKLENDELWLNASAEHTMAPMYSGEILEETQLPIRYIAHTTAFRREAGSYGKDLEGIIRLHQFNKLEMESFSTKDQSFDEHLLMIAIQEYLMGQLELPYQVLMKCTADIGFPNARGVDLEAWLPGQNRYCETHTADYITDFQTRRMKTRVRREDGSLELAHTNDATVFSERPIVAILENYQTKDGNVKIPEVLQKYMGGRKQI